MQTLARTYSPRLGRFVQPDPMGYVDGMNLYAFAHHAPGSLTDYFGFSSNDIDWGIVGCEAGSTVLTGAAALLACTALVVGGIVSLPAMLAAGGIAAVFSLTVSILHRGKEAIDAGVSDDDLFWKASVAGIGDQVGATDIYQGVTGTEVFSGETLGTKRRSELLGGGIGSLGTEAVGGFVAKPFAKLVDAKLPATKFSGKYWDTLSKPELAPELGPVAVGSSEIVVSKNALAMHIAAKRPVHITLGANSLENLDDVTLMAHGIRSAGTDELSGALNVRLDGYGDVSPERMAEILYLDAGWSGGTLRLAACNTGNFNPQLNGIFGDLLARELARLGVPTVVIAPTGPVSAMVPGSSYGLPRIRTTPKADPFYLQPGRGWEYFAY